jgi:phospholipid-binding lipoprotein MlaA
LGLACAAVTLAGCATAPAGLSATANPPPVRHDPFEGLNRGLYRMGMALDRTLARPVLAGYRRLAPRPVRRAVHNVIQNLDEPVVFVNDVLQAHPKAAAGTAVRFVANSTVGIGGIFDAAETAGIAHHDNGFGSTLGRYGVGPGPYIYLPLLGPTTLRDATGDVVDWVADPVGLAGTSAGRGAEVARTALSLIDEREQADAELRRLERTAVDPYATLRSVYLQSRAAEVKGSGETELEPLPELPEPAPEPPAEAAPDAAPQPPPQAEPHAATEPPPGPDAP